MIKLTLIIERASNGYIVTDEESGHSMTFGPYQNQSVFKEIEILQLIEFISEKLMKFDDRMARDKAQHEAIALHAEQEREKEKK